MARHYCGRECLPDGCPNIFEAFRYGVGMVMIRVTASLLTECNVIRLIDTFISVIINSVMKLTPGQIVFEVSLT
jgi:hypothetical protein